MLTHLTRLLVWQIFGKYLHTWEKLSHSGLFFSKQIWDKYETNKTNMRQIWYKFETNKTSMRQIFTATLEIGSWLSPSSPPNSSKSFTDLKTSAAFISSLLREDKGKFVFFLAKASTLLASRQIIQRTKRPAYIFGIHLRFKAAHGRIRYQVPPVSAMGHLSLTQVRSTLHFTRAKPG